MWNIDTTQDQLNNSPMLAPYSEILLHYNLANYCESVLYF